MAATELEDPGKPLESLTIISDEVTRSIEGRVQEMLKREVPVQKSICKANLF